jgi:SAM-dependent methyltransferase
MDDRLIYSRKPFKVRAFCAYCDGAREMTIDWYYSGSGNGEVWPAWTETARCSECGLNSRQRAIYDLAANVVGIPRTATVYLPERITKGFARWAARFDNTTGSEYVNPELAPGATAFLAGWPEPLKHEDMTRLSMADASVDAIISQDVFEHIPDYAAAFRESSRVLRLGGHLVFSIPFSPDKACTTIRASIGPDGSVEHLLPPQYHGNPATGSGSLCFQDFGWDILDILRSQGFHDASANLYWAPWKGHYGMANFTFLAAR